MFKHVLKTVLKVIAIIIAVVIVAAAGLAIYFSATEYKPADVEKVAAPDGADTVAVGDTLTLVTFNTGFASLGEASDFFMDGGTMVRLGSAEAVRLNMQGISQTLLDLDADIYMLQEVDTDSKRTYSIDQTAYYSERLGMPYAFALNYSAKFVPYPLNDMIGRVNSGVATYTSIGASAASRVQLPIPFTWPVRMFNLKRCLLITRIPVENSERELVIINFHLEAYDDGEGKAAQTAMLYDMLDEEYAKGNYVIAGGDFNQTFPNAYFYEPIAEGIWMPGTLSDTLPDGYTFAFDDSLPTCRLLDRPYTGNDNPQYYIIDGFIVSSNIEIQLVETIDAGFVNSDHEPVRMTIRLAD